MLYTEHLTPPPAFLWAVVQRLLKKGSCWNDIKSFQVVLNWYSLHFSTYSSLIVFTIHFIQFPRYFVCKELYPSQCFHAEHVSGHPSSYWLSYSTQKDQTVTVFWQNFKSSQTLTLNPLGSVLLNGSAWRFFFSLEMFDKYKMSVTKMAMSLDI